MAEIQAMHGEGFIKTALAEHLVLARRHDQEHHNTMDAPVAPDRNAH